MKNISETKSGPKQGRTAAPAKPRGRPLSFDREAALDKAMLVIGVQKKLAVLLDTLSDDKSEKP